jgi:hypothetical protein
MLKACPKDLSRARVDAGADQHASDHRGQGVTDLAPKELFAPQREALRNMCFEDQHRNLICLLRTGGDMDAAVVRILRD